MRPLRRAWYRLTERFHREESPELAAANQQFAEWLTEALRAEAENTPINMDATNPRFIVPRQSLRARRIVRSTTRSFLRSTNSRLETSHEDS